MTKVGLQVSTRNRKTLPKDAKFKGSSATVAEAFTGRIHDIYYSPSKKQYYASFGNQYRVYEAIRGNKKIQRKLRRMA